MAVVRDGDPLAVELGDGRLLQAPLRGYPRRQSASLSQRSRVELTPMGVHGPAIDEDIGIASILRGQKAPGARAP